MVDMDIDSEHCGAVASDTHLQATCYDDFIVCLNSAVVVGLSPHECHALKVLHQEHYSFLAKIYTRCVLPSILNRDLPIT